GATRHPDRLRITGDFADIATIRLALRIQRLESGARPVAALIRAREQAGAADREHGPRAPAPDEDAVHIDGVVVDVLAVAHVVPMLAAVETPNDAADFDRAIELIGIRGIDADLQHALGRVGARRHRDFREANSHRQWSPVLAAVVAAE